MRISLKSFFSTYLLWYLFFVSISGIIVVIGYSTSRLLLLYKDVFAIAIPTLVLIAFLFLGKKVASVFQYYFLFILMLFIFIFSFVFFTIVNSQFDLLRTTIQFRLELFIAYSLLTGALLLALNKDEQYEVLMKVVKFYILLATINAFFTIGESLFAELIYKFVGINPGPKFTEFGKSHGLLLRSVMGKFRAIGLLTGPFSLSEYLFFGMMLYKFVKPKNQFKYLLLLAFAIYCSTSKTAAIMSALFLLYYLLRKLFSERFCLTIVSACTIFIFVASAIITTDRNLYSEFFSRENSVAENSVLLRIDNIEKVMSNSSYSDFFGAGYAVNGNSMVGADNSKVVALDSAHIYILSSYGNVGIVCCFLLFLTIYIYLLKFTMEGMPSSIYLYWLISFLVNFMYNNPLINYPGYAFPIILSVLFISLRKYNPSQRQKNLV